MTVKNILLSTQLLALALLTACGPQQSIQRTAVGRTEGLEARKKPGVDHKDEEEDDGDVADMEEGKMEDAEVNGQRNDQETAPGLEDGGLALDQESCSMHPQGKIYKGFGGTNLSAGRDMQVAREMDRYRIKPLSALMGEFMRVLNTVPQSLTANAATFVEAPDRWFLEPQSSAVSLYTTYRVAYDGALTLAANAAEMSAAPTVETAAKICSRFARMAWSRQPTSFEVDSCVKIAVEETSSVADVKARWAHALSSILASTGFIAY